MATELPAVGVGQAAAALVVLVIVASAAIALGYFREGLLARIEVSPAILSDLIRLRWLFPNVSMWLDRAGKIILRANIIIEGQHYVGWAIFVAIVGTLIILLRA
jgi:hypothetical protein